MIRKYIIMDFVDITFIFLMIIDVVLCRECYNYKEDPEVRQCDQGCCGNKYEEYCCNVTLQIIGCVIGGVVVLSVIVAVAYYCYRKKNKHSQHGGLFGRFGMRSHTPVIRPGHTGQRVHGHGHYVPPTNMGHSSRPSQGQGHMNPAYMEHYPNPPDPTYRDLYPSAPMQAPPVGPTAPMPPPYTVEPPSYVSTKDLPPPPAYSTVVSHSRPGYKYDEYYGNMPPPST